MVLYSTHQAADPTPTLTSLRTWDGETEYREELVEASGMSTATKEQSKNIWDLWKLISWKHISPTPPQAILNSILALVIPISIHGMRESDI